MDTNAYKTLKRLLPGSPTRTDAYGKEVIELINN
jgi:hypothetical protein